jgi:hypothetical protein
MTIHIPDKLEMEETKNLIPYALNSRTHTAEQIAQIVASIIEFGFTAPILLGQGCDIIAGHARTMAAEKLQMPRVPVIRLGHLTEAQRRAYVIADNRLALNSGWNEEALKSEFKALKVMDFNLGVMGFTDEEAADMLRETTTVSFQAGAGNNNSGKDSKYFSFDATRVSLSDEEAIAFRALLTRYIEDKKTAYGFVGWICRACSTQVTQ